MPPIPMLASAGKAWPAGEGWVLEPKWDGFRLNPLILRLMQRIEARAQR